MKNKGFTLIELIGVIIIIGVIAIIAIPLTTQYIEQAHLERAKTNANVLLKSAQDYYANVMTDTGSFEYKEIKISESQSLLNYKGKLPDDGYITIDTDSTVVVYLVQDNYCVIVSSDSRDGEVTQDLTKCGVTDEPALTPDFVLNDVILDGVDDFYDSGYSLFDEAKDFTIITAFSSNISTASTSNPSTLFHCMREASPYPGIAFDQMYTMGRIAIKTPIRNVFPLTMYQNKQVIAIKRDITSGTLSYYIFNETGEFVGTNIASTSYDFKTFDQHLIVGAYQKTDGTKGRFFNGTVNNFSLYMQALDDTTIESIMTELNK